MNIRFLDKLSATVFHNILNQPGNLYVQNWLMRFFTGAWCDRVADFDVNLEGRALFSNQRGELGELRLSTNAVDVYRHPEFSEILLSDEFDWSVWAYPVDPYGMIHVENKVNRIIVGGLINHGTWDKPQWSSHT